MESPWSLMKETAHKLHGVKFKKFLVIISTIHLRVTPQLEITGLCNSCTPSHLFSVVCIIEIIVNKQSPVF